MTSKPSNPISKKSKKKKKADPFWPIVIILSILAFTGSFWFFYMLTSKINTRSFPTTETPKLMQTASQTTQTNTMPANDTLATIAPASALSTDSQNTSPTATKESKSNIPLPTAVPSAEAVTTTSDTAKSTYRVQVGSYTSREEATQIASQLSAKGYSALISEEGGSFKIQIGAYESQDKALALAEEITQQGYEVVVRKGSL